MDCDGGKSRIPSLRRSASVRVRGERTIPESAAARCCRPLAPSLLGDAGTPECCDEESAQSVGSTASLASCGSTSVGKNGVPGPGVRSTKFVLHCQRHFECPPEGYLTPTQRRERELRQLRSALARATRDAQDKEERLAALERELDQLRLGEQVQDTQERGMETDDLDDSGIVADLPSWTGSRCSKETQACPPEDPKVAPAGRKAEELSQRGRGTSTTDSREERAEEGSTVRENWSDSTDSLDSGPDRKGSREADARGVGAASLRKKYRDLKHRYVDRTESLLQMLGDLNAKYLELRPAYETTQERLRHLERELSEARAEIEKQEQWHSEMYLKMYRKGQEAAQFEREEDGTASSPPRGGGSIPALLQQLRRTESELERSRALHRAPLAASAPRTGGNDRQAEYTLRFLKDAVFYFLTDRTDCRGHLNAIQSILGFSEAERAAVAKAWRHRGRL
ncbi:uncharacterized protein LOC8028938 isoform X2 [Ixodes scapularis]|uniref:uncharacterized protein LOC8028938 isoform X2 n=1 Tax=Ixodes scapularis TaxID=6945 RepID=UPI001A9F4E44|nr:uncharacterized protein LOC8028938 isoform X2 [Ixodes scapularis]